MEFECVSFYQQKEYEIVAVYAVAFSLRKQTGTKKNLLDILKRNHKVRMK